MQLEETAKSLVKVWEKTSLLEGIDDSYKKSALAVLLENQRIVNHHLEDSLDKTLSMMTIPLSRRAFGYSLISELVSFQPLIAPIGLAYTVDGYGIIRTQEIETKPRLFKHEIPKNEKEGHDKLAQQADNTLEASQEFSQEMVREVVSDLRTIATTQLRYAYRSPQHLVEYLRMASGKIVREVGQHATWIVASPSIAMEIAEGDSDFQSFDIPKHVRPHVDFHQLGLMYDGRMTLYVDPLAPVTSVVMGNRGKEYLASGYVYSPYVLVGEAIEKEESYQITARIGKKLFYPGFYASITVDNYSIIEQQEKGEV